MFDISNTLYKKVHAYMEMSHKNLVTVAKHTSQCLLIPKQCPYVVRIRIKWLTELFLRTLFKDAEFRILIRATEIAPTLFVFIRIRIC